MTLAASIAAWKTRLASRRARRRLAERRVRYWRRRYTSVPPKDHAERRRCREKLEQREQALQRLVTLVQRGESELRRLQRKQATTRSISDRGVAFIKSFEGFYPAPYNDGADGTGNCTIGYGTLLHLGPCTAADRRRWGLISKQKADELFRRELREHEAAVKRLVKVPLTQGQYDALVSFSYNVGTGALAGSTLLRRLNAGAYKLAADQFLRWIYGPPGTQAGLLRRRRAERRLFLTNRT